MKGRVVTTTGDTVLVKLESSPAARPDIAQCPPGCPAPCKQEACPGEPALVRVKNPGGPELRPGQTVSLRREGLVSQSLRALLPPIAGFVLGYVLAARFLPPFGGPAQEGLRALAGLSGMFLLALPVYFFRRRHQPAVSFSIKNAEVF